MGVKELLRLGGFRPGQQTDLKRVLRDLLRTGEVTKEGKRFHVPTPQGRAVAPPVLGGAERREEPRERRPVREPKGPSQGMKRAPAGARQMRAGGERGGEARAWERPERVQRRPPERRERVQRRPPVGPGEVVEGVLHLHRDGFGFVHPLGGKGENVFLPAFEAQRALDKDLVRVLARGPEGRREGRLLEVLERRRQLVVGIYRHRGRRSFVEPHDVKLGDVIRVPATQIATDGDVVKVRLGAGKGLVDAEGGLYGEVAGSMGRPGHPSAQVLSLAFAQGFSDEFAPEVMDEADVVALEVTEQEWRREERRDLRKLPLVTIDGADARDFDDAVYAEPHAKGWRLVVAIADVTHYVRESTALDAEALRRATSVYLPDRVLPLLPERLSNGICSLRPDEDRMCMVADLVLDAQGQRLSTEVYPAVMRSAARCTYEEVQSVLDGKHVPHRDAFRPHFERLEKVARSLRRMRERRGAIDFDLEETKVLVGEDGSPERVVKRERLFAHRLIEECMLAANEAVARFFHERGLPTVYRFHAEPDEEKLLAFMALAGAYGFTFGTGEHPPTSAELNAFVQSLQGHPEQRALNQLLLRSMMQAVYSSENVGHYGLAAEHYLHFTSPIRRYPDLLVHRLLKAHWERGERKRPSHQLERETERLESMAMHSSERERAAMQAEREVSQYYVCLLMKDRVGEEFDATVAGVADFGFVAELGGENVEGLVRAETVGPGAQLDPVLHALVYPGGRRVRVGNKLRVRLDFVNMERRQLELEAIAFAEERAVAAVGPRVRKRGKAAAEVERAPARVRRAATAEAAGAGYTPSKQVMRKRAGGRAAVAAEAAAGAVRAPRKGGRRVAEEAEERPPSRRAASSVRTHRVEPEAELRTSPEAALRAQSEAETPENYGARPAFVVPGMDEGAEAPVSPHPGFDRLRALASMTRKKEPVSKPTPKGGRRGR